MILYIILAAVGGAIGALAVYILVTHFILKGKADAIIEKANVEAENIKQQKIFQAKEKFLQMKSEHEASVNSKNSELRDRENNIKSREGQLNQQAGELNKKMKDLESQKGQINAQRTKLEAKKEMKDTLLRQFAHDLLVVHDRPIGIYSLPLRELFIHRIDRTLYTKAKACAFCKHYFHSSSPFLLSFSVWIILFWKSKAP